MIELVCHDLGRLDYDAATAIQQRLVRRAQAAPRSRAELLLVEHDPAVITLGRRALPEHVLADRERLAAEGIAVRQCTRGGAATYHGPGQLVAYPIVPLRALGRTLREYVEGLEEAVIRLLARLGLAGERADGRNGVWVGGAKIASVGVAVSRWVCWHGLAVNVCPRLEHFSLIVPCGLRDARVTSLAEAFGRPVEVDQVKRPLAECLAEVFGLARPRWADTRQLESLEVAAG